MYTFYIGTKNFLNEMTKHPVSKILFDINISSLPSGIK